MTDHDLYSRRTLLKAAGAGTISGVAGCTSHLEEDDSRTEPESGETAEEHHDDDQTQDEADGDEPSTEYSLQYSIENEADLTVDEYLEVELYIEKQEDGETETLEPDTLELNSYNIREHDEYSEDLLREVGLYQENSLEHIEENTYRIPGTQLLPGKTQVNIQIELEDPEHNQTQDHHLQETVQIQKTPEQTQKDTWIQNPELYKKLREQHVENELDDHVHVNSRWDTWKELGDDVKVTTEDRFNLEEMDREEKTHRYAYTWITKTREAIGAQPSGQANYLANILEGVIYDNVTAGRMNNLGHNTVLLHFHDENKTYHVETGRGGITAHPPRENGWTSGNPDKTPLWETENNLGQAQSTLIEMSKLGGWKNDVNHVDDQFLVDAMTALRDDTDVVPGLIQDFQELALTTELSPTIDYKITGTAEEPEFTPL